MCDDEIVSIVCDNGSDMIKAGLAGEDAPTVIPNIVESSKSKFRMRMRELGMGMKDPLIGPDAHSMRGAIEINYPIEDGIVTDWDDMEWRGSGTTPSTTSSVLAAGSNLSSSLRLPSTPRPTGRR